MNKTNKVFVYGTLKRGNSIRGLDSWGDAEFVGTAVTSLSHFRLHDLGAFPAVSKDGSDHIAGEVWTVDDDVLSTLDRIEGYPDFYDRMQVDTSQGRAWMYYIPDIENYRNTPIESDQNQIASWRNQ